MSTLLFHGLKIVKYIYNYFYLYLKQVRLFYDWLRYSLSIKQFDHIRSQFLSRDS